MTIRQTICCFDGRTETKTGFFTGIVIDEVCIIQYVPAFADISPCAVLIPYYDNNYDNTNRRIALQPIGQLGHVDIFAWLPNQTIEVLYAIKKHKNMYADLG